AFSPAKVIFAGIGVFLLVSCQGCCGEQRCSRRAVRTHWILFQPTRNVHRGDTDCGDDKHNYEDNGGGAYDLWDRNERAKAGIGHTCREVHKEIGRKD
ncbi:hypothetical protein EDB84DRAFT_1527659, partial [Lactarius hengduanensis]